MKKFMLGIIYFLQIIFLLGPIVLEMLSKEEIGIKKYIIAENKELSDGLLTTEHIRIYMAVLAILTLISLLYFMSQRNNITSYNRIVLISTIVFNTILMFFVTTLNVKRLLVFYFLIIGAMLFTVLQYLKLAFIDKKNK